MRIVLASSSPRRQALLAAAGVAFDVVVPAVDESTRAGEGPDALVRRLAHDKAFAVDVDDVVIAADTEVVLGGAVLGKPLSVENAVRMLERLSGVQHEVLTGFC